MGTSREDVARQLQDDLIGTCRTVSDYFDEDCRYSEDDVMEMVAEEIFNCETCGWWVGVEEMMEDDTCLDCTIDE